MERENRTSEDVARIIQFRQILLNSARKRCAPLEKSVRSSMGEKYPLGMTPEDVANEIELNIEDAGYKTEMPNINLSSSYDIERAIIEGQTKELMDVLLLVAVETQNLSIAANSLELYNRLEDYEQISPAKINAAREAEELEKLEFQEEYLEMKEEALEEKAEMQAAIKEDIEELRDAEKEEKENKNEAEKKAKILKLPHKHLKESLGFEPER